jgi:DNA replication protein DnaC
VNEGKIKKILKKYEDRRDESEIRLIEHKKEINAKFPEIMNLNDDISKIGLRLAKIVLEKPEDRDAIVFKCREDIEKLTAKREDLFLENNIPLDYLELKHRCPICKDKAFLPNGEKCTCFKQELINEAYNMSNLGNVLDRENFFTFNLNLFSNEKIESKGVSPREHMISIYQPASNFVENFGKEQSKNLFFYGSTGLGKTFMCNCIAKDLLDKGFVVIYQTAFMILQILEDYKFGKNPDQALSDENYRNLFDCDLLIIDDLGTEMNNSFTNSEIFNIVNTRLSADKSCVVSSNLNPFQIGEIYSQRVLSRILDKFEIYEFIGNDLRWERFK